MNSRLINKAEHFGFVVNTEDEFRDCLIESIKQDIPDISDTMDISFLIEIFEAINTMPQVCPFDADAALKNKTSKVEKEYKPDTSAQVYRVDITQDPSHILPIVKHLSRYPNVRVCENKIGLSLKFKSNGLEHRMLNFNHLRVNKGVLIGHVYLSVIKTENQLKMIGINHCDWYRGYAMLKQQSILDVINLLTDERIKYLISRASHINSRRSKNVSVVMSNAQS